MVKSDFTRCEVCAGNCDEPFKKTAVELLMTDDGTLGKLQRCEEIERTFRARLSLVEGCELTTSQVSQNLEWLMEGNVIVDGR